MKLPVQVISRLNDLVVYSFMDSNTQVVSAYRLTVKKRLYVRCMRVYAAIFKNRAKELLNREAAYETPYVYNVHLEGDKFGNDLIAVEEN